jgi:hypothetical protein
MKKLLLLLILPFNVWADTINADFNHNGIVDSNDAAWLFAQFGLLSTHPAFRPDIDMNSNGVIDSNDAARLFGSFGRYVTWFVEPAEEYELSASGPADAVVADLNGDGIDDVAFAMNGAQGGDGGVSVLLSGEEGRENQGFSDWLAPGAIAVDGTDLVLVGMNQVNTTPELRVYTNDGTGDFTLTQAIGITGNPTGVAVLPSGYIVATGSLLAYVVDGIVTYINGSNARDVVANGTGFFTETGAWEYNGSGFTKTESFSGIKVANNNGEAVLLQPGHANLCIFNGEKVVTEPAGVSFNVQYNGTGSPASCAEGDFNNDGLTDLVVGNGAAGEPYATILIQTIN